MYKANTFPRQTCSIYNTIVSFNTSCSFILNNLVYSSQYNIGKPTNRQIQYYNKHEAYL